MGEFAKHKINNDGRRGQCNTCIKEIRQRQPGVALGNARRSTLEQQEYEARLAAQGGVCGCCRRPWEPGEERFCGEHDHACCRSSRVRQRCGGCERDLLCHKCNIGLSNFDEDPELLRKARQYLRRHQRAVPVSAEVRSGESRRSRPRSGRR